MIRWSQGGEATVVEARGDFITVRSTVASAPGSRLDGRLPSGCSARLKVQRCRADGEAFLLDGKLMDASRASRDEIARLSAPAGAPDRSETLDPT